MDEKMVKFVKEIQEVADKYNLFLLAGEGQQLYEKLLEREQIFSPIIGYKIKDDLENFARKKYDTLQDIKSSMYISKTIYYMDLNEIKKTKLEINFSKDIKSESKDSFKEPLLDKVEKYENALKEIQKHLDTLVNLKK